MRVTFHCKWVSVRFLENYRFTSGKGERPEAVVNCVFLLSCLLGASVDSEERNISLFSCPPKFSLPLFKIIFIFFYFI